MKYILSLLFLVGCSPIYNPGAINPAPKEPVKQSIVNPKTGQVESLSYFIIRTNPPHIPITNITLIWDNHWIDLTYKVYSTTNLLQGFQFRTNVDGPGIVFKTADKQQEYFKVWWTNVFNLEGGWIPCATNNI